MTSLLLTGSACAGVVDGWVEAFAQSELVFQRGTHNAPFVPLAFLDLTHYADAELEYLPQERSLSIGQTSEHRSYNGSIPRPRAVWVIGLSSPAALFIAANGRIR